MLYELVSDIIEMQDFDPDHQKKGTSPYPTKIVGKDYSSRDDVLKYINGLIKTGHPKGEELLKKFKSTYYTEAEKKENST